MITYLKGDATLPQGNGKKLIIHVVNNAGVAGAGFVLAITERFGPRPMDRYRQWAKEKVLLATGPIEMFKLGSIQTVNVSGDKRDLFIVNMVAQVLYDDSGVPPIRYEALEECLNKVNEIAVNGQCSIHAPRFGAGLSGGSWGLVEELINKCLPDVPVTIYDYDGDDAIPWRK